MNDGAGVPPVSGDAILNNRSLSTQEFQGMMTRSSSAAMNMTGGTNQGKSQQNPYNWAAK
jgi:hypothetical protein